MNDAKDYRLAPVVVVKRNNVMMVSVSMLFGFVGLKGERVAKYWGWGKHSSLGRHPCFFVHVHVPVLRSRFFLERKEKT